MLEPAALPPAAPVSMLLTLPDGNSSRWSTPSAVSATSSVGSVATSLARSPPRAPPPSALSMGIMVTATTSEASRLIVTVRA